jgi:hypothetical protein
MGAMDAQTGDITRLWAEHSLQATALVHEAQMWHVGLAGDRQRRAHSFAVETGLMRCILVDHVLVDHALTRLAAKRSDSHQEMVMEQAAEVLEISPQAVMRNWSVEKAWLHGQLTRESPVQ